MPLHRPRERSVGATWPCVRPVSKSLTKVAIEQGRKPGRLDNAGRTIPEIAEILFQPWLGLCPIRSWMSSIELGECAWLVSRHWPILSAIILVEAEVVCAKFE